MTAKARGPDGPRWMKPRAKRYGGICCIDGCGRRQAYDRIWCLLHLAQMNQGMTPHVREHFENLPILRYRKKGRRH